LHPHLEAQKKGEDARDAGIHQQQAQMFWEHCKKFTVWCIKGFLLDSIKYHANF